AAHEQAVGGREEAAGRLPLEAGGLVVVEVEDRGVVEDRPPAAVVAGEVHDPMPGEMRLAFQLDEPVVRPHEDHDVRVRRPTILLPMPDPNLPEGARLDVDPQAKELGERFRDAGFQLYLVGGAVRARFLGGTGPELDFATDAKPDETIRVLRGWADRHYLQGVRFGTVGARKDDRVLEITTFREEVYPEDERKPRVTFGKDIKTDLSRRDFTINAMAIGLPAGVLLDPFGGVKDLAAKRLDTPVDPEIALAADPLRMLRAARFVAQLDVTAAPRVVEAITRMRRRLEIISHERIQEERN